MLKMLAMLMEADGRCFATDVTVNKDRSRTTCTLVKTVRLDSSFHKSFMLLMQLS